ncbi:MAG: DUF1320 family protein [Flavobacteriales bacterium]|nr:DUF1320 family protein [Flavobacteriales bacterium]
MAYAFLTAEDVNSRIRNEHRTAITDNVEAVELSCESMAIAKVKSALGGRYDVAAIFPATPDPGSRNPLVVLHTLNVFVYLMYRRINPRKIPMTVKEDHDESLAWLDKVAEGKESPDLPAVPDPEVSAMVPRVGGGKAMGGHYF